MDHERTVGDATDERGGSGPPWKLVALLVVLAGLVVFFFQNGQTSEVNFLWLDGGWPQWTVIGFSVIVGIVIDRLWQRRRARTR